MIKRSLLISGFIVAQFLITLQAEQSKERILLPLIMHNLKDTHFKPRTIDDSFSEELFNSYIQNLDYDKKFLLVEDIANLKKYFHSIDEEIKSGKSEFFTLSKTVIAKRIAESKHYYTQALKNAFDFSVKDSIEIDPDSSTFVKTTNELQERWKKRIKYRVLLKYSSLIKEQEERKSDTSDTSKKPLKSLNELEKEAREKVLKTHNDWFRRVSKLNDTDRLSLFINSMTMLYDPHTNYFPPKSKEDFDISMSGQLEGIGALLKEQDGIIEVVSIVPGSASSRQGELEAGDKIVAVAQGKKEPVDVVDMPLSDVVRLIRGKKGTEVRLTVKKVNSIKKIIPIVRDVVVLEETYAKSSLLNYTKDNLKLGYIHLPKFYVNFNKSGGRRCSKDVENEIKKLKKDTINGLILDLRNNSGGSLKDVVDMFGLFIKTGPVVQVKARKDNPQILKDTDPKVQYDGPLIVMINNSSASASEILAAALQDYKRGIVVGTSKSSYGKGTVQSVINLDRYARLPFIKSSGLGALKVTTQKFYRINGGATQKKGVVPDIILPDIFMELDRGEKKQENVMDWSEISSLHYEKHAPSWDINTMIKKSNERVSKSKIMNEVIAQSKNLKVKNDRKKYTLVYKEYVKELEENKMLSDKIDSMKTSMDGLKIAFLKEDTEALGSDSTKIENAKKWIEFRQKDVYLHETILIMKDMINY